MQASSSINFDTYSPVSPDQLRQNLFNYIEHERPLEIDEDSHNITRNNDILRKRHGSDVLYSFIKRPSKGPQTKLIRLQIFDFDEMNNSVNIKCNCTASICGQYIVEYTFSDEVYKCAQDLLNKMHRKLLQ